MADDEINQDMVYFTCMVCEHVFQEDPMILVKCPMCGSGDVTRT